MTDAEFLLVATTHDDEVAARALARSAIEARTAACAQVSSAVTSVYWWEGEVTEDREWVVTFKTTADRFADLKAHLETHHTYDVPELVATPIVDGGPAYLDWIRAETRS